MVIPFTNTSSFRSGEFKPFFAVSFWFLFVDFLILGWIGQKPVETPFIEVGMVATAFYFGYLTFGLPLLGILERNLLTHKV
jgi:ubiquinol-cytochrome c reductase cytochrome b subunit